MLYNAPGSTFCIPVHRRKLHRGNREICITYLTKQPSKNVVLPRYIAGGVKWEMIDGE